MATSTKAIKKNPNVDVSDNAKNVHDLPLGPKFDEHL